MQAPSRPAFTSRVPSNGSAKRQLLGSPAAKVAPAWRPNAQGMKEKGKLQDDSKILLSRLPADVGDAEVEELFKKTVGPVKEAFIIYNSQGRSKGMAVVTFVRTGDAAVARAKYDGKYVDQKRPIKIEIVTDGVPHASSPVASSGPRTLLSRLGSVATASGPSSYGNPAPVKSTNGSSTASAPRQHVVNSQIKQARTRTKKGPRRVKKSLAQLDQEMEAYRAASDLSHRCLLRVLYRAPADFTRMVAPLYTTASGLLFHAGKILVLTIGLPARGKTHISRALERYLRWMGVKTQVVSLGDYRRKTLGGAQKLPPDYFTLGSDRPGEKSEETIKLRQKVSSGCEQLIWEFFEGGGQVVIYDANNGTKAARQTLAEKFSEKGIHVIMLETVCDNKEIIETNIRSVKISSPDYRGWDPDLAVKDYYDRIRDHEKHYETVEETTWPFIRIFNVGEKIMVNSRIVFFLMNIHNRFRTIYFARSGQSLIEHSYKADSDLSPAGWEYAERLKEFVVERRQKSLEQRGINPKDRRLVIWSSSRRRAHHTAWPFLAETSKVPDLHPSQSTPPSAIPAHLGLAKAAAGDSNAPSTSTLKVKVVEKTQMSEINPGVWDGLTPDQARKYYPEEWDRFAKDPYTFRAPRAESYHDLSVRLEPILIELEREQEDLLIIGHSSVIRCILAYLIGLPASEIPAIEIARGDLLEVVPTSYGVHSQAFHFWDGPGRSGEGVGSEKDPNNFYENYAEDTKGKRRVGEDGEVAAAS
ncbi:hypothetical protein HWV62_12972 [Athelia sp. TMB]|nr:hypothetical protein HWV62_12972 [Athelia sp. TMB]